jgi:hypothetical protein
MYDLCWYAYGGTVASTVEDILSRGFLWDPPTELPTMYVQKTMTQVIEPHIKTRSYKQFLGHKFGIGGSKK